MLLAEVAAELGAHRRTVRRLLDRHGIRRVRRTAAERAAAEAGRSVQAVGWQARRAGRLAELGFADLAAYLKARHVEQGWSIKRMRAELRSAAGGWWGSWPGWDSDPDRRLRLPPPERWASVEPRRCCGTGWRWGFSPGSQVLEAVERGGSSAWRKRLPSEPGGWSCSTPGPRCRLCGIPWFSLCGAIRWRVIDG